MKKLLKIILVIVSIPLIVTLVAYQTYKPEDYCKTAKISKDMYEDYTKELGMTHFKFESLGVNKQLALIKKNTDYAMIKATYNLKNEAESKCRNYINLSKWDRFELDVYSGEYFK